MKEDGNESNFMSIRQWLGIFTILQIIYQMLPHQLFGLWGKQLAVTNRKAHFLSVDKYAHYWNWALQWSQGGPSLTCGWAQGGGEYQGRGQASTQSDARWGLRKG